MKNKRASGERLQTSDLDVSLAGVHAATGALLATADGVGSFWKIPRAPGKWSPSQVVEHVARIMEESANVVAGVPSAFPTIPFLLRPIVRLLVFKRILRRKAFLKMKAAEAMDPPTGSATPKQARVRLEAVLRQFDQACRAREASGQGVASTIFGSVPVADFARFQELHVRHHHLQLPR
ncbi:MAG: DUF1569 domain-containing protein [Gemmatimonadaceae bacterium]